MKVMSRIPASGRRQLLEVPSGLALYTIAVGKLFDGELMHVHVG